MSNVEPVRADLIQKIKRQVTDKKYKIKSNEIADKIAQRLREEEAVKQYMKLRF